MTVSAGVPGAAIGGTLGGAVGISRPQDVIVVVGHPTQLASKLATQVVLPFTGSSYLTLLLVLGLLALTAGVLVLGAVRFRSAPPG